MSKIFDFIKKRLIWIFLIYLRTLAKIQLSKNKPTIIGITGSAGKTSLMHACEAVLKDHFSVKTSVKANSETGIPLNILGIKPQDFSYQDWLHIFFLAPLRLVTNWEKYDIYIAELGIDSPYPPKNMGYLLTIVKPKIGVFLNVNTVHGQFFEPLVSPDIKDDQARKTAVADYIALEKGKLIEALPENGTAVLNLDDERVKLWKTKTKAQVVTFSQYQKADLMAQSIKVSLRGFSMQVVEGHRVETLKLNQVLDEHYSQTFLSAVAVGRSLGLELIDCIKGIKLHFKLPPGRMTRLAGLKSSTILDSSYNASSPTMISALKLLSKVAKKRRVAILGDMRELGKAAKLEHQEVAKVASQTADFVITVGPLMKKWLVPMLIRLKYPKSNIISFTNPHQAAKAIEELIKYRDTILVKGSQNQIFLEIVVKVLLSRPKEQEKLLCRRGNFWDKKRNELKKAG